MLRSAVVLLTSAIVGGVVAGAGCGRIGFDATATATNSPDAGSGAEPSVFTPVTLPPGGLVSSVKRLPDGTLYALVGYSRVVRRAPNATAWTSCAPTDDEVNQIAVDATTGAIYLASYTDVERSTDDCATWAPTGLGQYASSVGVLGGSVFAGTKNGLWQLTAGTWTGVTTPLGVVADLKIDESLDRIVIGGDNGFARSTDGGASWQAGNTGLPGDGVLWIVTDPSDAQRILALADLASQELDLSTDGGGTWTTDFVGGFAAAWDPSDATFVAYSSYIYGVEVSTNSGAGFSTTPDLRSATMDFTSVLGFAYDDRSGLYAATGRGVFYAPDHTLTWTEIDDGLEGWEVAGITASAAGTMYLATYAGVLHTTDGGATWSDGYAGLCNNSDVNSVALVPGAPDSIIVAGVNCIARSDDDGATFTPLYDAQQNDFYVIRGLTIVDNTLIAPTGGGIVTSPAPYTAFAYHELGDTLREANAVLAVDGNATAIAAASTDGVFYSGDGGSTFTDITGALPSRDVTSLAQLADGTLLAGTLEYGVFRAARPGLPWTSAGLGSHAVLALLVANGKAIAATGDGVFASTDGYTWTLVPGLEYLAPRSLALDTNGDLLVGTAASGLFRAPFP